MSNEQDGLEKTLIVDPSMVHAFIAIFGITRAAFIDPHIWDETENVGGGQ